MTYLYEISILAISFGLNGFRIFALKNDEIGEIFRDIVFNNLPTFIFSTVLTNIKF